MADRKARGAELAAGAILVAGAVAAYCRTFSVPFVFDDLPAIVSNPTIRHWSTALVPPLNATVSGRPVLNLSLAVNYAIGGTSVKGYHAVNLGIHVLAGLVLFGIVRRTLAARAHPAALGIAFCSALLWLLHPLQTESVTYVAQRAESLMGLFYLLTLYCFVRGSGGSPLSEQKAAGRRFYGLSIVCCALGMATKEVMVSAPLIVLLYDRTFIAGSLRAAWQQRRSVYLGLAATWLVLALLVISTHGRNGDSGFGSGVSEWKYGLTQFPAVLRYLELSIWPQPLIFDYGTQWVTGISSILPSIVVVSGLVVATFWALGRSSFPARALGFAGVWFFAILAPTSLIPGNRQTAAEHRMYLALIPVIVLAVVGIYGGARCLQRAERHRSRPDVKRVGDNALHPLIICLALAAAFLALTWQRNLDYRTVLSLWTDTVAKNPTNPQAQDNLGSALAGLPGRMPDAISHFQEAIRLNPALASAHNNLGNAWAQIPGRTADAIPEYEAALRLNPNLPETDNNLANVLNASGRMDEAVARYQDALRLDPNYAAAHLNLAITLLNLPGRTPEAITQLQTALRLQPGLETAREILTSLQAPQR